MLKLYMCYELSSWCRLPSLESKNKRKLNGREGPSKNCLNFINGKRCTIRGANIKQDEENSNNGHNSILYTRTIEMLLLRSQNCNGCHGVYLQYNESAQFWEVNLEKCNAEDEAGGANVINTSYNNIHVICQLSLYFMRFSHF